MTTAHNDKMTKAIRAVLEGHLYGRNVISDSDRELLKDALEAPTELKITEMERLEEVVLPPQHTIEDPGHSNSLPPGQRFEPSPMSPVIQLNPLLDNTQAWQNKTAVTSPLDSATDLSF